MTTIGKWEYRRYAHPEPPHPDHGLPYYEFRRVDYVDARKWPTAPLIVRKRVSLHCMRADTVERFGGPEEYLERQGIDELATERARA